MICPPFFVTHLEDEDIEEALSEEGLSRTELVFRDGVSLPGWYWAKTRAPGGPRMGRMQGPYLTQEEAFNDAKRSVH